MPYLGNSGADTSPRWRLSVKLNFTGCQQWSIASVRDTVRVPFHYDLPLPKLREERPGSESVRLVSWLVEEGALLARGTPVAIVSPEGGSYEVRANGEGLLRKRLVSEGQAIREGIALATIGADGEKGSSAVSLRISGEHGIGTMNQDFTV